MHTLYKLAVAPPFKSAVAYTSVPILAVASYTAITITFIATSGYIQYAGAVARDETGNAYLGWSAEL